MMDRRWVALVSLLLFTQSGFADTFRVVARDGSPVTNAVISTGATFETGQNTKSIMDQVDKAFKPHVLAVPRGGEVIFPNSDQIRHHVYSFSEPRSFELRLYSGVPEEPIRFDAPGIVVVGCNIHDNMIGYIFISPRESWAVTDVNGVADLPLLPTVHAWHPGLSLDAQQEIVINTNSLTKDSEGRYEILLDMDAPNAFPQAIRNTDRNSFKRYLDP